MQFFTRAEVGSKHHLHSFSSFRGRHRLFHNLERHLSSTHRPLYRHRIASHRGSPVFQPLHKILHLQYPCGGPTYPRGGNTSAVRRIWRSSIEDRRVATRIYITSVLLPIVGKWLLNVMYIHLKESLCHQDSSIYNNMGRPAPVAGYVAMTCCPLLFRHSFEKWGCSTNGA